MKVCKKCGIEKSLSEFSPEKTGKDGLSYRCKECNRERALQYYNDHKDECRAKALKYSREHKEEAAQRYKLYREENFGALKKKAAEYRAANREVLRAACTIWRKANPEKSSAASMAWQLANPERVKAGYAARHAANPEARATRNKEYRDANPGRTSAQSAKWARENKAGKAVISSRYRASKLRAIPQWSNPDRVQDFYDSANGLSMLLGEWYEVDHIVPLQGKTVCGLHCEDNLQILHHAQNASKGNRAWPDMPSEAFGANLGVMYSAPPRRAA